MRFASANAPTACANASARTAPNVVSSGKSSDATSTVPSYSSIRFTGYALGASAVAIITLESERVVGTFRPAQLGA